MFRNSRNKQIDMFKDMSSQLSKRKQKMFNSAVSWHNIFFQEIVSQVDESIYSILYDKRMGRPNAPVRVLLGMMILKEGNGWSDEQLFEECRFNLKVMSALGMANIDEDIPVESTYYEFRKLLGKHHKETGNDLLKTTFHDITAKQVGFYKVSGKKVRLDSKLINSNIAKSNRLQLIVEAVRKYLQDVELSQLERVFSRETNELLSEIKVKSASNITYPLNGKEKKEMLVNMGGIILKLLTQGINKTGEYYQLLERIYEEQYEEVTNEDNENNDNTPSEDSVEKEQLIRPKNPKQIASTSVQSIHDPDAAYRTKGEGVNKQTVSGFHSNITESCSPEDSVNLILDVETVPANVCEDAFLIDTVEQSNQVLKQGNEAAKIEEVITDGGYDSISNREAMLKDNQPVWSIAKMKGGRHIYEINKTDNGEIEVYEKKGGQQLDAVFSKKANKYVITKGDGTKRYMTLEQIENYINHQKIVDQVNEESYNLRATVESTIHQSFHRLKKRGKVVYRGLLKCHWYVLSRAFWVNLVRIVDKKAKKAKKGLILMLFATAALWKRHNRINVNKMKI